MWDLILNLAQTTKLSDIHVHAGAPIAYREHGDIVQLNRIIEQSELRDFLQEVLSDSEFVQFVEYKDHDFAIEKDGYRFRVNAFQESDKIALVMRLIKSKIPNFDDLNLPAYVRTVPSLGTGLVLVTGPTGAGKSTTLASILDVINSSQKGHIITIEDPIEFKHTSKSSVISQREVGRDTKSFLSALRASLREDPDVILVGELRDLETIQLALTAAETGHLVFGTLHTNSAPSTITRIIDVFPPAQQEQIRSQLALTLRCVLTQNLLKRVDQPGRVAAFELMICNTAIKTLIRENKIFQIPGIIQTSRVEGMITMENSLKTLALENKISPSAILR
ncbi:MAG: PilT/PilU family type 4a pilus ATPase [Betaproteobacteria bacterium]|nr:PilT/PilU family type 4a pilus ATPase [Betaproteobacteria bacterium]